MYAHEIGRMSGDPHVEEDTVPRVLSATVPTGGTTGCVGRNGARWALLQEEGVAEVCPQPQTSRATRVWLQSCHSYMAQQLGRQHNDIHSLQDIRVAGLLLAHSDIIMTSHRWCVLWCALTLQWAPSLAPLPRGGCRRSCEGSGGTHHCRSHPVGTVLLGHSCWPRPRTPAHPHRGPSYKSPCRAVTVGPPVDHTHCVLGGAYLMVSSKMPLVEG